MPPFRPLFGSSVTGVSMDETTLLTYSLYRDRRKVLSRNSSKVSADNLTRESAYLRPSLYLLLRCFIQTSFSTVLLACEPTA